MAGQAHNDVRAKEFFPACKLLRIFRKPHVGLCKRLHFSQAAATRRKSSNENNAAAMIELFRGAPSSIQVLLIEGLSNQRLDYGLPTDVQFLRCPVQFLKHA
jgi:hypothetical protein